MEPGDGEQSLVDHTDLVDGVNPTFTDLAGDLLVQPSWGLGVGHDASPKGIYVHNLLTGQRSFVSVPSLADGVPPAVWGTRVAWWTRNAATGNHLQVHNLADGSTETLLDLPYSTSTRLTVDVSGLRVAWSSGETTGQVGVYDLLTSRNDVLRDGGGGPWTFSQMGYWKDYLAPEISGRSIRISSATDSSVTKREVILLPAGSVAPVTTISLSPSSPDHDPWYSTTPTVTLTADQPNATIRYQWDGTDPDAWTQYFGPFPSIEGSHTLHYYASDALDNVEPSNNALIRVDTTPPTTVLNVREDAVVRGTRWFSESPTITLQPDEEASTRYQWDATETAGWKPYDGQLTAPEGEHSLYFYSTDQRGNDEDVQAATFRVDSAPDDVAPTVELSATPEADVDGVHATFPRALAATNETATIYVRWDSSDGVGQTPDDPLPVAAPRAPGGTPRFFATSDGWSRYSGAIEVPEGEHVLYAYAVDVHGNISDVASLRFKVQLPIVNTPPVLSPIGSKAVTSGTTLAFRIVAVDSPSQLVTFSATGLPEGASLDPDTGDFEWTPTAEALGDHIITFGASDGQLMDFETVTITVVAANSPPVATDVSVTTTAGVPVPITLVASDPDGDPLTWLVSSPPTGGTLLGTAPSLTYVPRAGFTGTDAFSFTVSDGRGGSATLTATVTVKRAWISVIRISGGDRYGNALVASRGAFTKGSVRTVVISTGENWRDPIAAAGLAGCYRSPVLLTKRTALPSGVVTELRRLGARNVVIVGGTNVVSDAVARRLKAYRFSVSRVGGPNNYLTAQNVALRIEALRGRGKVSQAFVARSTMDADGWDVSSVAWARKMPILWTSSTSLASPAAYALRRLDVDEAIIIGPTSAVSTGVATSIDRVPSVDKVRRWGGPTVAGTAVSVADELAARGWASWSTVAFMPSSAWSEGLAAGPAIGKRGGVLLYSTSSGIPDATRDALVAHKAQITRAYLFARPTVGLPSSVAAIEGAIN